MERLESICAEEKVSCDTQTLNKLVESSGGDLRRAITTLQSCARLKNEGEPVTEQDVIEVTGVSKNNRLIKSQI